MISKLISEICCDKHEFEKAKGNYNKALEKTGFSEKIKYQVLLDCTNKKSSMVSLHKVANSHAQTNVGKIFMKLIVKHFTKHHRYHRRFNKNTIKLSYSCIQNMGNIIIKHNNKQLYQSLEQPTRMGSCRDKASCPIDGNCLQKLFVYQAQIGSANSRKYYLWMSEDGFKTRYNNHNMSFRNKGLERKNF